MTTCLVLMPLLEDLASIFHEAIHPAVTEAFPEGCECLKADDVRRPGMVSDKILEYLLNADLIVAVVSDIRENVTNPNVMYELGIAHSFRKATLLVANEGWVAPFDISGMETIFLDFSRLADGESRKAVLRKLRDQLRSALGSFDFAAHDQLGCHSLKNPVSAYLGNRKIFREDFSWLWGYHEVLERELRASTVWEVSRDLYWPSEEVFFRVLREMVLGRKKRYCLIPDREEVRQQAHNIMTQLRQENVSEDSISACLKFVPIDPSHFDLLPITVVLYDANTATSRDGILCEPMQADVGHDPWDPRVKAILRHHEGARLKDLLPMLWQSKWTDRREEATFDIRLDQRTVGALATAFRRIWNGRIEDAARQLADEERRELLDTWLIPKERL